MHDRPPARRRSRADKRLRRRLAQRRYRQNVQDHVKVAPVKVDELMLDYLTRVVRWLDERDADDPRKVGEAIARGLTESAEAEAAKK